MINTLLDGMDSMIYILFMQNVMWSLINIAW